VVSNAVNTPVTYRWDNGLHAAIHEAALYDYPGTTILVDTARGSLKTELVGGPNPWKASVSGPFSTPWRTVTLADNAAGLANSHMALDLNAPQVDDPTGEDWAWAKPMKYVGIWWEMHLDKSKWSRWNQDADGNAIIGDAHGLHGATTENTRRYMAFAAAHGFDGVLVEGWNTGWEKWIGFDDREGVFDFVTPYGDFDLPNLASEAAAQGLQLIAHHETSAAVSTYEAQLDTAYDLMASLGQRAVKTGYVGPIIPRGEHHHGQWMVQHYQRTVEAAARRGICVNIHEPIKDTGIRRTWPNLFSREGARGQEFNAWGGNGGNPPNHNPTLAFTRMLSGPMDFTPGVVHLSLDPWKPHNQINTTHAQQLGLYVVFHSPIQMACDLPEHYEQHPEALAFIERVPCDWAWSEVIAGEVGEYAVTVRAPRDDKNGSVYLGAINGGTARSEVITTAFLDATGHRGPWLVEQWVDARGDYFGNDWTLAVRTDTIGVAGEKLQLDLAPGGGAAVIFSPMR
jgi:alpha-glucosidase